MIAPFPSKLRRELKRLVKQFADLPNLLFDVLFSRLVHDQFERPRVQRFDGTVQQGDRVAIYLIFPRNGLLESHKRAIAYMRENGYAPFVVSNLPIAEDDREWLTRNTWKFLSRPNRGYDFGGYREGFLTLVEDVKHLEYLAFFNDSSWFPVPGADNWLAQAEALDVAYAGAASSWGIKRVALRDFREITWTFNTNSKNFHYCSYALLVRKEILRNPAYHRFWERLILSASKHRVVRRGEIGMTRFVLRRGFSHNSTYDIRTLPQVLMRLSDDDLNRTARSLVTLDDADAKRFLESTLATLDACRSPADRDAVIRLVLTVTARIGVSYVVPDLLCRHHGFAFLKKSSLGLDEHESQVMLNIGKTLAGRDGRVIKDEMEDIRRSRGFA